MFCQIGERITAAFTLGFTASNAVRTPIVYVSLKTIHSLCLVRQTLKVIG